MRSARNRMLASYLAEVGSTFVVSAFEAWDDGSVGASLRSAMDVEIGLFTVYHSRRSAQRKARPLGAGTPQRGEERAQRGNSLGLVLLQMKTAQQFLKTRLRADVHPYRVDLQIDESGLGFTMTFLEGVQGRGISAEHGVRF